MMNQWCTNNPIVNIHTIRKCWNFIRWCFFPVSILNVICLTKKAPQGKMWNYFSSKTISSATLAQYCFRKSLMSDCFWFFDFIPSTFPFTSFTIIFRWLSPWISIKIFTPPKHFSFYSFSDSSISSTSAELRTTSVILFSQKTCHQSKTSGSIAGSDVTTSASKSVYHQ